MSYSIHKPVKPDSPIRLGCVLTRVSDILEVLEDDFGLRPLLRFLVPTFLGDRPNPWGDSWGIKVTRSLRSFSFSDHNSNLGICEFGKWHRSGHELVAKTIRTQVNCASRDGLTPTMTIDREYTSDLYVGFIASGLTTTPAPRSSGAQ